MKIFLSWSGPQSKAVADALAPWLRRVIQAVEPWQSSSIEKGARWSSELATQLEEARIGIICLTRRNLTEPWINFEAGALSKIQEAHVCTFLLDLTPSEVEQPLAQFQHTMATKSDVRNLLGTINRVVSQVENRSLSEADLDDLFESYWSKLESDLESIRRSPSVPAEPARSERELLEEVLEILRERERREALETRYATEVIELRQALDARKMIERAKGILMRRTGCTEQESYRILQRTSQDRSQPMVDIARAVLDSEPKPGPQPESPSQPPAPPPQDTPPQDPPPTDIE